MNYITLRNAYYGGILLLVVFTLPFLWPLNYLYPILTIPVYGFLKVIHIIGIGVTIGAILGIKRKFG